MDIYEEITMFTKPKFNKDEYMEDLVRDWRNYDSRIYDDLENFSNSMCQAKVAHEREETLPSLLYDENKKGFEELCSKEPMPVHRNLLVIDNVNIYVRKEIGDELSAEEQAEQKENFHDEITDKIQESFKNDDCYDYIYENKSVELEKIPDWAIYKLYDLYELNYEPYKFVNAKDSMKSLKYIKNKDFNSALKPLTRYEKLSSRDSLNFIKEVVKIHGTNSKIINDAIYAVTEHKNESPAFMSKLLNDTLKTEEYKKAFDSEQLKEQEKVK